MFRFQPKTMLFSSLLLMALMGFGPAIANEYEEEGVAETEMYDETDEEMDEEVNEEVADSEDLLRDAATTLDQMRSDSELAATLENAKAVFIAPDFGRAALVVGASGGQGVLVTNVNGEWKNPVFYNFGEGSLGAQAGIDAGQIAMIVLSEAGLEPFKEDSDFSINAEAGLTILDWSEAAEASTREGDIVLWTDTEGLFAGAAVGIGNISADEEAIQAYYGANVTAADIISGNVENPHEDVIAQN